MSGLGEELPAETSGGRVKINPANPVPKAQITQQSAETYLRGSKVFVQPPLAAVLGRSLTETANQAEELTHNAQFLIVGHRQNCRSRAISTG